MPADPPGGPRVCLYEERLFLGRVCAGGGIGGMGCSVPSRGLLELVALALCCDWRSRGGSSPGRRGYWSGEFRRGGLQCLTGSVLWSLADR